MKTPYKPTIQLENVGPEIKSYIYQVLMEFEPFTTPTTTVAVTAKDPLKLIKSMEANGVDYDRTELKSMYRISIALIEDGTKIEEEGLHEDIFQAIKMAKDNLVKVLIEIQDNVVTAQDRTMQINSVRQTGEIH